MTQLYTRAWLEKSFSKAWIERLERDCVEGWDAAFDYVLNRLRRPLTRERLAELLKRAVENGDVETWPAYFDWKQHNPAGFLYFSCVSLDLFVTELNKNAPAGRTIEPKIVTHGTKAEVKAEKDCETYLLTIMESSPNEKTCDKADRWPECKTKFPKLSENAFNRLDGGGKAGQSGSLERAGPHAALIASLNRLANHRTKIWCGYFF